MASRTTRACEGKGGEGVNAERERKCDMLLHAVVLLQSSGNAQNFQRENYGVSKGMQGWKRSCLSTSNGQSSNRVTVLELHHGAHRSAGAPAGARDMEWEEGNAGKIHVT